MAKQSSTSINIDAATAAALDARKRDRETRTARLGADLSAYHALLDEGLRRARRVLSPAEASLFLDVFHLNSAPSGQVWSADRVRERVADAVVLDDMDEKWEIDGPALLGKLTSLGDLPAVALADWAEAVWDKGDFKVAVETEIFRG